MKKLFTLAVALVFAMVASAQMTWSYYQGDGSDWEGLGTGSKATYSVGILVPGELFAGAKIRSINVPAVTSDMTSVSVWVRTKLNGANIKKTNIDNGSFMENQYTSATLSEDYEIPAEGIWVGYTFTSSYGYPVAIGEGEEENSLWLKAGSYDWEDYSGAGYGVSPLQIVLADFEMIDNNATLKGLEAKTLMPGTPFKATVTLINNGKNAIENIDYTIDVDGKKQQNHLDLATKVEAGLGVKQEIEVEGVSADAAKSYTVSVSLDKVNGQPNAKESVVEANYQGVIREVARRTVVEEFTGTGCGWCTRGWVGMEYLKANYQDKFVGIAMHKYNNSDPMYVSNYPSQALGLTAAPSCIMDRKLLMDPFYGTNNEGIWNALEAFNAQLPSVDVKATGTWNEDQTKVEVTAEVEALSEGLDFSIACVLTADELSGTSDAWMQANYYPYYYSASELPSSPADLAQFGSGGKNGQASVFLTFNDVLIGSTYTSNGKNSAKSIEGANNTQAGVVYTGTNTVLMPTKTSLKNAIDKEKVFANVLVIDNKTGYILNAVRVKVEEKTEVPDAIQNVENEVDTDNANVYDISGRKIVNSKLSNSKLQQGLYIVNGKKIIVR